MSVKIGYQCKLYRASAVLAAADSGAVTGATWNEMTNVQDAETTCEYDEAEGTTRANNGWEQTYTTIKKGEIGWTMVWDTADAGFTAIKDAFFNNTPVALAGMDGAIATAGSQGLVSNFSITQFKRSEPIKGIVTVNVTAKVKSFTQWYTAS